VRLEDKSEFQAKLVGSDEETDLALIKIDSRPRPARSPIGQL
jgi:S1-C subfamily serine protease